MAKSIAPTSLSPRNLQGQGGSLIDWREPAHPPTPPGGIRQAIGRAVADYGRTIRLPVHVIESLNRLTRARGMLAAELGRDPRPKELTGACRAGSHHISSQFGHELFPFDDLRFRDDLPHAANALGCTQQPVDLGLENRATQGTSLAASYCVEDL